MQEELMTLTSPTLDSTGLDRDRLDRHRVDHASQAVCENMNEPTLSLAAEPALAPTQFGVARTHREVLECWRLVHDCYSDSGLIDPNLCQVHTTHQAANFQTAVIYGRTAGRIDSTLSVIADGPLGLPLDQVYKSTLDNLRNHGRKLVEVGLLADARSNVSKSLDQSFGTMRIGFYRALYLDADIVIGVHPRHVNFYLRMMGLEVIGPMSQHPKVKDRPVVPMRLDIGRIRLEPLPRLLRYIKANPVEASAFDCRYRFGKASMGRSSIQRYLDLAASQHNLERFKTSASRLPMQQVGM